MAGQGHEVDHGGLFIGGIMAGVTAITLNQWVAIATLIYFVVQILVSIPKVIDTIKIMRGKNGSTE
jgi:UDP-N-acetylmuramyl pentapeptide phosphotransferase/UDP-N-acetylglucosamine-1-phosphate transferase